MKNHETQGRTLVIVADDEKQFYQDLIEYNNVTSTTPFSEVFIDTAHVHKALDLLPKVRTGVLDYSSIVIFLDLYFPEASDGVACIQAIRDDSDLRIRTSPIYVCSLDTNNDYVTRCYSLGVNGYVDKSKFPECIVDVASLLFSNQTFKLPNFNLTSGP